MSTPEPSSRISKSLFGTQESSENTQISLTAQQRQAERRRRGRIALAVGGVVVLIMAVLVTGILYYQHRQVQQEIAAMEHKEATPPPANNTGNTDAPMKVEIAVTDPYLIPGQVRALVYDAIYTKPSEISLSIVTLTDQNQPATLTINGESKITIPGNPAKEIQLTLDMPQEDLCAALNAAHARIIGQCLHPLAVKPIQRPVVKEDPNSISRHIDKLPESPATQK